ncbi:hypothetical protein D1AOALGA4SA_10128 [Olavius algarvensis Delta 1 endosymbiont]|nr:hypothetical protein D1AOALGA4SA_10128 [Olavius algarvensis Delta 1 endosymbiont]
MYFNIASSWKTTGISFLSRGFHGKHRIRFVNPLYSMQRSFNHENTKVGKHEKFLSIISCFRHFVLS